jgi:hypothetical protein
MFILAMFRKIKRRMLVLQGKMQVEEAQGQSINFSRS